MLIDQPGGGSGGSLPKVPLLRVIIQSSLKLRTCEAVTGIKSSEPVNVVKF